MGSIYRAVYKIRLFNISSRYLAFKRCYCKSFVKQKTTLSDIKTGPDLNYFIASGTSNNHTDIPHPYISSKSLYAEGQKVYFEVYGCQMNSSDADVVWSILRKYNYKRTSVLEDADIVLLLTCAIREGAETKIWNRLNYLKGLKKRRIAIKPSIPLRVGILGCMAERLKEKLIESEKCIDVVAGPDSYRDLPRLLSIASYGKAAVNVLLSLDETYADIVPVNLGNNISSFVSIMRGCDNMCSYCIVPFTRGRERSRPLNTILDEVHYLSDKNIKEITLLGQNVNSYRDVSNTSYIIPELRTNLSKGFKTIYKSKIGGLRFADLLDKVSCINKEMRIRFTSPHPKDFPNELIELIKERHNICKHIHLPAQSGNSRILSLMRRGYTREAYIDLVNYIRSIIPNIALSSDFMCGFCEETEDEFSDTVSLIQLIKYNYCYLFPYSMREKTHAHRMLKDDIPYSIKIDRVQQMINVFRCEAEKINRSQVGEIQLVLVERKSKRSDEKVVGRNDGNTKVILSKMLHDKCNKSERILQPGNYVKVVITGSSSEVLHAEPLSLSTVPDFYK